MKEAETKLVRSEQEIRQMLLTMMITMSYTVIALSPSVESQLKSLIDMAELDPNVLGVSYFGRIDN